MDKDTDRFTYELIDKINKGNVIARAIVILAADVMKLKKEVAELKLRGGTDDN